MLSFQAPWWSNGDDVGHKITRHKLVIRDGEMEPEAEDFLRKVSWSLFFSPSSGLQSLVADAPEIALPTSPQWSSHGVTSLLLRHVSLASSFLDSVPHFYLCSNWRLMARFAVPVPEEWLPLEEPSFVSFDEVGSIFPGEPYDKCENRDPYPEFCWMSKRAKQGIVDEENVDNNVETLSEQPVIEEEKKADVESKPRPRFFKRLITKLKNFARPAKRQTPVSHEDSFYSLPPTPNVSSFASLYTHS